jgi:hypothetical protein
VVDEEVRGSREQLAAIVGRPVEFFSFPFGRVANITDEALAVIRDAEFDAVFSAHGGTVGPRTDLFDIPRIGVSSEHRPLDLMMEIEGLALGDLARGLMFWKR